MLIKMNKIFFLGLAKSVCLPMKWCSIRFSFATDGVCSSYK